MKRSLAAILILALMGLAPTDKPDQFTPATQSVRFTYVDVRIDPHDKPLAAYQIEFVADARRVKLVGVEGGSHPAFVDPPYYDPAALSHNRVILAAFNAGSALPKQSFRAATLHLEIVGDGAGETPKWSAKLIVASDSDGTSIPADVSVSAAEGASR